MLELYNANPSTCSQKVRMVLAEKGLEWVDHQVDFGAQQQISDWYLKLNPNGVVPTLVHDGDPIVDSSVINEYLDEVFPEVPLRPAGAKERAHMRAWRQYIDEVPTAAIRVPSFHLVFRRMWAHLSPEEFARYAERLPLRKHFYRKMQGGGFSDADLAEALDRLQQAVDRMEGALADGRPWLVGGQFTLADVSIMPAIVRLDDLGLGRLMEGRAGVLGWYDRIQARPAFQTTYCPGSRIEGLAC